jgi:diamine N-acetyltransferase
MTDTDVASIDAWPRYPPAFADLDYALREGGWLAEYRGKPQTRCEVALMRDELIGFTIVSKTGEKDAEFRIALRADRLGQGFGATIAGMVLERAFSEMGLSRVHLIVRKNNPQARRLYQKLGFVELGERIVDIRGQPVAFVEMAIYP